MWCARAPRGDVKKNVAAATRSAASPADEAPGDDRRRISFPAAVARYEETATFRKGERRVTIRTRVF